MEGPRHELAVGDRAPNFVLPDAAGRHRMLYERTTGRPTILLFTPGQGFPAAAAAFNGFAAEAEAFAAAGLDIFAVSLDAVAQNAALNCPYPVWSDQEKAITAAYLNQAGIPYNPQLPPSDSLTAFLLDANQRILALRQGSGPDLAAEIRAFYRNLPLPRPPELRSGNAPVLLMPALLEPVQCGQLIDLWHSAGHEEGTVGSVVAGRELDRVYGDVKRRLDHTIMDPALNRTLQATLGRRLAPEVQKAFQFEGFRFDRFLVVCYDSARDDRFRPHRDNLSPETQDRRFAMTLNLNSEDYEGGELVFPEYGPERYKPASGGAVIFSCSLIHEALPVAKGRRFALLTFLRSLSANSPIDQKS